MTHPTPTAATLVEHVGFVHALARAALHGDPESEDVAQEVLAAALRGPLRTPEHQRSWLARAINHRVLDLLRGRARRRVREHRAARAEAEPSTLDLVARAETGRHLVAAVLALEEPLRAALLLRFYENLPPRSIAARLGIPVETVRTRVKRGIALLRAHLAQGDAAGGRSWIAALVPLSGGRPRVSPSLLFSGGLVMKQATAVLTVLLLGLGGYGAVRLSELTREVEELRQHQAVEAAPPPPAADAASLRAAETPGPTLEVSPLPADGVRLDRLERALDGLLMRLKQREEAWVELERLVEEVAQARRSANEAAATATARNVISATAQVQASARVDEDRDGTGEFAGYLEMSGASAGRMARTLVPPVLASAFRTLTANGEVLRAGYLYRIYLPDARGFGVGEPATGFAPGQVDPNLAENTWCLYAWPEQYGRTGTRTFFTNQGGDVLATDAPAYSGSGHGPTPDAAFLPAHRGTIMGAAAISAQGNDGNPWKQVN